MYTNSKIKSLCFTGAVAGVIVILLTVTDIIAGSVNGTDLTSLPQTAADKFIQIQENTLAGLYNLDFLNLIVTLIMIPTFIALFIVLRHDNEPFAVLALAVFILGTTVFVANNASLPMMELGYKYSNAESSEQKVLFAAAGEALIAKGAHGSAGVFPGFALITISQFIISLVMLSGTIFSRSTAMFGIAGTTLLLIYLVLVTFIPGTKENVMIFAAPGGISSLIWMILFTIKLFRLSGKNTVLTV